MKNNIYQKRLSRIWVPIWLAILMVILTGPTDANSEQLHQTSDAAFWYGEAREAEGINDYVSAGIALYIYRQMNPPEYANNIGNQRNIVNDRTNFYVKQTIYAITLEQVVAKDLNTCGHFPCNQASSEYIKSEVSLQPLPSPPNAAMVCTGRNYTGICKVLYVGDHTNFTQMSINDQISSVMVGGQVKLTLYLHATFDSRSIALTSNDPNLSDNRINSNFYWNDNASAARVLNR